MKSSRNQQKLLSQLRSLLEKPSPDYGRILKVSSRLASLDPESVRFTADSGLISRLGKELVARQETAVSELVKNAYDADAREVRLIFTKADNPGGELVIMDDGVGMTREELVNGFMRLASTEKIREPISPRFGRQRAGRKGIGRFAAQRLGTQLELTTQTRAAAQGLRLLIDWREFERERDLFVVPNQIGEVVKDRDEGTTLRIRGLREGWTDAQIARVYRYLAELIQPYPLAKRRKLASGIEVDPGFKAAFYRRVGQSEVEVASVERMVLDYAVAEVTARVDARGRGSWRVISERYSVDYTAPISIDEERPKHPFEVIRNVNLKAHYFIWDPELVPGQQLSRLRNLATEQAGVRLYRNGFRVLPYGERRDDWLGLDKLYSRRTVLYPLANTNWFGFVEVRDPEGNQFEETSSREGLANNAAYQELVTFASSSLVAAAQRIASARERKLTAGQRGFRSKRVRSPSELLTRVASDLEKAADDLEKIGGTQGGSAFGAAATVRGAAQDVRSAREELIHENAMLRVLSSLGLTIGVFTHEVRHQLFHLRTLLREWLDKYRSNPVLKEILPTLDSQLDLLQSYAGYFDVAISANVRRELEPQDLTQILFDFIKQFQRAVERSGATLMDDDHIDEELITRPMHPSEWSSVLGNLLTNSIKAIRQSSNRGRGRILIRARREHDTIFVDFADNGKGISAADEKQIFEPFFTTTHTASNSDELTGTGLGLTIVRDILSAYGGEIYLISPPEGFATCFRIEIPSAEDT